MKSISSIKLANFKKYRNFSASFQSDMNILIGDNEAGKSSILLAIDLALSGSRTKVETIGIDTLFNVEVITAFLSGKKKIEDLPVMFIELYLNEQNDDGLFGRINSSKADSDGIRLICEPIEEYSKDIRAILDEDEPNFPYEFYSIRFHTFSAQSYNGHKRPLKHVLIDSSQINSDYANREYTRAIYSASSETLERSKYQNEYRKHKSNFRDNVLAPLNQKLAEYQFSIKTNTKTNLESDLHITENEIPIEQKGKGRQCFIKTEFALKKVEGKNSLNVILLEEPENHLSHLNMRLLVQRLANSGGTQLFIATHSNMICTRLDLRKALMLSQAGRPALLKDLTKETAEFFMKAPDNNVLEFILSKKVILVEGDAEFILIDAFYNKITGNTPEQDGVHILAIGGTSFKRYMEVAKLLGIQTASIRDNDKNFQKNCVENYEDHVTDGISVFADKDDARSTFEICVYLDNVEYCEALWKAGRKSLSVQEYMLANKAEAALELLENYAAKLEAPDYIKEAIAWIRK